MPVTRGHGFLVHPSKAAEIQPNIGGVELEHSGKLFNMLSSIFHACGVQYRDIVSAGREGAVKKTTANDALIGNSELVPLRTVALELPIKSIH